MQEMSLEQFKMMDMEARLRETICIVEATPFEQLCLWKEWSKSEDEGNENQVKWKQVLDGWLPTVGKLNDRPVVISLHWAIINGAPVLFWNASGQLADHIMIENWFKVNVPQVYLNQPGLVTDANNFHIAVHSIDRMKREST